MKPQTKLAIRRFALRWLRKLVDVADDRLHAAEVRLREELLSPQKREADEWNATQRQSRHPDDASRNTQLEQQTPGSSRVAARDAERLSPHRHNETFAQWEKRRSGVEVISKREARTRRRLTAAAFDARFA